MKDYRGHTFLPGLLGARPYVIDLGAHCGEFASLMRKYYQAEGLSLEASPDLAVGITGVEGFRYLNAAAAGRDGMISFAIDRENLEGGSISAAVGQGHRVEIPAMSFHTLLAESGRAEVDLVKMDIESAELELIEQTSLEDLRKARQWTIEFHEFLRPEEAPRVMGCIAKLKEAGFEVFRCSVTGHKDMLAVRRDCLEAGSLSVAGMKFQALWMSWKRMLLQRVFNRSTSIMD